MPSDETCMGCGNKCRTAFCDGCAPPIGHRPENYAGLIGLPMASKFRNGQPIELVHFNPDITLVRAVGHKLKGS